MGWKLRRQVMDALPAGLTASERLIISEIADWAREDTRRAYGAELVDTLLRRSGVPSLKQLGKLLGSLAHKGIELRVVAFQDAAGRPVVAWRGHQTTFEVPPLDVLRAACVVPPKLPVTDSDIGSQSV